MAAVHAHGLTNRTVCTDVGAAGGAWREGGSAHGSHRQAEGGGTHRSGPGEGGVQGGY
jgi:hypothetical protein